MNAVLRSVKPGWILLVAAVIYAGVMTSVARDARAQLRELRLDEAAAAQAAEDAAPVAVAPDGPWFPVPGAELPGDDAHLPGAARPYRSGVSQGFDFYGGEAGVPIAFGTPVVAATAGTLVRLDRDYQEPDEEAWEALLNAVADGADEADLDRLRGRQLWLEGEDGRVYRYAHLARIEDGLAVGDAVYRGQVLAAAGNSGTDDGVRGGDGGVRVHFEIWEGDRFFGEGLEPADVRAEAAALFVGP